MPRPGCQLSGDLHRSRATRHRSRPAAGQPGGHLAGRAEAGAAAQRGVRGWRSWAPRSPRAPAPAGPVSRGPCCWPGCCAGTRSSDGVPGAGYVHPGPATGVPWRPCCPGSGCGPWRPRWSSCRRATTTSASRRGSSGSGSTQVIALIRAEAPEARIALVTVFPGRRRPAAAYQTDQVIVAADRAANPGVIIVDRWPRAGRSRTHDGLPPTAVGDAWIARKVAGL